MTVKVGLAMGSGGLRGFAHIGVLRVLEREEIRPDFIAGCSIGSLVGALYAAGHSADTIYKLADNLKRRHWLDFTIPKMGVIAGERTLEMLRLLTQRKNFQQLDIPLAVVATELKTGREVVLNQGEVAAAVRGSISVPGVFTPFQLGDMLLVDGAVVNPNPIDVAHAMGADVVIAVDLIPAGPVNEFSNLFDVIIQSLDIMERELFKTRLSFCDILIQPAVAHLSPSSFADMAECVTLGEAAMEQALPAVRKLLAEKEDIAEKCESPCSPVANADPV